MPYPPVPYPQSVLAPVSQPSQPQDKAPVVNKTSTTFSTHSSQSEAPVDKFLSTSPHSAQSAAHQTSLNVSKTSSAHDKDLPHNSESSALYLQTLSTTKDSSVYSPSLSPSDPRTIASPVSYAHSQQPA